MSPANPETVNSRKSTARRYDGKARGAGVADAGVEDTVIED
jgi:hypothetical protein